MGAGTWWVRISLCFSSQEEVKPCALSVHISAYCTSGWSGYSQCLPVPPSACRQALGREWQSSDRLWRNRAEPLTLSVGRPKASQGDGKMRSPPRSCSTQRCRSQERRGILASEGGRVVAPVSVIRPCPSPPSFLVPSQGPKCSLPTSYLHKKVLRQAEANSQSPVSKTYPHFSTFFKMEKKQYLSSTSSVLVILCVTSFNP